MFVASGKNDQRCQIEPNYWSKATTTGMQECQESNQHGLRYKCRIKSKTVTVLGDSHYRADWRDATSYVQAFVGAGENRRMASYF